MARGLPGAINVIALAAYTRLLTPEGYGHYAIALSITVFIYSTLFQWINLSLSRFFPTLSNTTYFLRSIILIFFCLVVFTAIVSMVIIAAIPDYELRIFIVICTIFLWAYAWFELTLELVRCRLSPLRYGIISIIKALLTLCISLALVIYGTQACSILLGNIIAILIVSCLFFWKDWENLWKEQKNTAIIKELIYYGIPLIPTTSLTVVVMSTDRLLLGWFLGSREAGLYSTSYDLTASTMILLLMAVSLAGYPFLTRTLEHEDSRKTYIQLNNYLHLLLAIGVPTAAGFALLAGNISSAMLGQEFVATATELIPWISLIGLITGLKTYYFDLSFQLGKNTKKLIWVSFFQAAISIGLNLLLIPYYGKMSLVYAGLAASTIGCGTSFLLGRKVFFMPFFSWESIKILLASLGMIGTLWPTRYWVGSDLLCLQIIIGIISYGVFVLFFNIANVRKKVFYTLTLLKEQPS